MSQKIWGGTDYLPLVWDRWLTDKNGTLLTVTLGGRPVGVSKVTRLAPREVWLEGLRLDPALQRRGLSRQINAATYRAAMKFNPRSIRYATGTGNEASRRLAERRGFWLVARAQCSVAPADKGGRLRAREARPSDLPALWGFIRASECQRAMGGLYGLGWTFPELTRRRLRGLIAAGRVLVLPRTGAIRAAAIIETDRVDGELCLGFVDGPDRAVAALADDARRIARAVGQPAAFAMLPGGRLTDVVRRSGYDVSYPNEAIVYEFGARGFSCGDEPFESVAWRTLRAAEPEAASLLVDLIAERAPRPLHRENVRDFLMRHVLPDATRASMSAARPLADRTGSDALRDIHKALTHYLATHHGLGGESLHVGKAEMSFRHRGKRLAAIRLDKRSLRLTLGPGFGACFTSRLRLGIERTAFMPGTRDAKTGRYAGLTLWLSHERDIPGALRAIDIIMASAARVR